MTRKPRSFWVTDEEWETIKAKAKQEGLPTSLFIRRILLGYGN